MMRSITRLLALSTLFFGVAGSLSALPTKPSLFRPIRSVAQATLSAPLDAAGTRKLSVFGPAGTSATVSWASDDGASGSATATVGPEGRVESARLVPPRGVLLRLTLTAPGCARQGLADIGAESATLTVAVPIGHWIDAGHR